VEDHLTVRSVLETARPPNLERSIAVCAASGMDRCRRKSPAGRGGSREHPYEDDRDEDGGWTRRVRSCYCPSLGGVDAMQRQSRTAASGKWRIAARPSLTAAWRTARRRPGAWPAKSKRDQAAALAVGPSGRRLEHPRGAGFAGEAEVRSPKDVPAVQAA